MIKVGVRAADKAASDTHTHTHTHTHTVSVCVTGATLPKTHAHALQSQFQH